MQRVITSDWGTLDVFVSNDGEKRFVITSLYGISVEFDDFEFDWLVKCLVLNRSSGCVSGLGGLAVRISESVEICRINRGGSKSPVLFVERKRSLLHDLGHFHTENLSIDVQMDKLTLF